MRLPSCVLAVCLVLAAASAQAQTSVGFQNPDDLDALLSYRLPNWGYRIWDGTFQLDGAGMSQSNRSQNTNNMDIASNFKLFRESEARTWSLMARASGVLERTRVGRDDEVERESSDTFLGQLAGNWKAYTGSSDWFVGLNGIATASYLDNVISERDAFDSTETSNFRRQYSTGAAASWGYGRLRDVTPLVRAQRLSERLLALGRAPLSSADVVAVAEVLAQESGYRTVFDRGDRRFWRDVFEPLVLDDGDHFSPYEIHYLEEVINESVGSRSEGWFMAVQAAWAETRNGRSSSWTINREQGIGLIGRWSHNLSLERQVVFFGEVGQMSTDAGGDEGMILQAYLQCEYLETLTDRNRFSASLRGDAGYMDRQDSGMINRVFNARFMVEDNLYVEDNVALRPYATVAWQTMSGSSFGYETPLVYWEYGVSLHYYFDHLLY